MVKAQIRETLLSGLASARPPLTLSCLFMPCDLGIELIASNSIAWIFARFICFRYQPQHRFSKQKAISRGRPFPFFLPAECFPC